jgi:primosomal replication protein N
MFPGLAVTGNRIELDGLIVSKPDVRVTPAGTPVMRLKVDCGSSDEGLTLGVVITGEQVTSLKHRLAPGRPVKVSGRLRALKPGLKAFRPDDQIEVVASSVEPVES